MDKTRVFVSSTCYDLQQIRRDLEEFIRSMGYQPVLSDSEEIGIPPGLDNIQACKWLVTCSDIFVLIIGGSFGTEDHETGKSITNIEYDTAYELGMPIYPFVDKEVWSKRDTYRSLIEMVRAGSLPRNKVKETLGRKIEDERVFEFIDRVSSAGRDEWIRTFSQASDIIDSLKNNWSLLFKQVLSQKRPGVAITPSTKLVPKLQFGWLGENEEILETIVVKPISPLDRDALIQQLNSIKPDTEIITLVEDRANEIERLIIERHPSQLGLLEKPKDVSKFIRSVSEFQSYINQLIEKVDSDFDNFRLHYRLHARSAKPSFIIENCGNVPAQEIVIYLKPHQKVTFISESDIWGKSIRVPDSLPEDVQQLINLVKNLDSILASSLSLPDETSHLKSPRLVSNYLPPHPLTRVEDLSRILGHTSVDRPPVQPRVSINVENGEIRIELSKLKHGFIYTISNDDIYLCPFLAEKEIVTLEYFCYADNLPDASHGELTVIAE